MKFNSICKKIIGICLVFPYVALAEMAPYHAYSSDFIAPIIRNPETLPLKSRSSLSPQSYKELDCALLYKKLNKTHTTSGAFMLNLLLLPLKENNIIEERQAIIKNLVEHPELLAELDSLCKILKEEEQALLSLYDAHDNLSHDSQFLYFNILDIKSLNKSINKSPLTLDFSEIAETGRLIFDFVLIEVERAMIEAMRVYRVNYPERHAQGDSYFNEHIKAALSGVKNGLTNPLKYFIKSHNPMLHELENYQNVAQAFAQQDARHVMTNEEVQASSEHIAQATALQYGKRYSLGDMALHHEKYNMTSKEVAWFCALSERAFHDFQLLYFLNQHYKNIKKSFQLKIAVARRMNKIAKFIDHAREADVLLKKIGVTHQALHHKIENFFIISKSDTEDIRLLRTALTSQTLRAAPTWYSRKGHALVCQRLLQDHSEMIAPLLETIGLLDAYRAIAHFYLDQQNNRKPICFVTLEDHIGPHIQLTNFATPVLNTPETVLNSIEIGAPHTYSSMLLTGPSYCGKTTFMKSIAHCVILAQAFGITTADSATITPFNLFLTSIDVQQNLSENTSGFVSRKKRFDMVYAATMNLKITDRCLSIIDEPLGGAIVEFEAARRVYDFGKDIAYIPHHITLIATHLEKPAYLEKDTQGRFANFHPELLEPELGSFIPTYRILPGTATWWFTDQEKCHRFIDWLSRQSHTKVDDEPHQYTPRSRDIHHESTGNQSPLATQLNSSYLDYINTPVNQAP